MFYLRWEIGRYEKKWEKYWYFWMNQGAWYTWQPTVFRVFHWLEHLGIRKGYLVMFYGLSTFVGYFMPNLIFTWFLSEYIVGNIFLNEPKLICLHTVKCFNYCYLTLLILFAQLNGFKYCYVILIDQFNINHLFANI